MPTESLPIDNVSELIRLALTPAFLIVAVSSMLGVLTARLARVADQAFSLEAAIGDDTVHGSDQASIQLRSIAARAWLLLAGMALCVIGALLVAGVIALLYFAHRGSADLSAYIGPLFVMSIAALALAMLCLLFEVGAASARALGLTRHLKKRITPAARVSPSDSDE